MHISPRVIFVVGNSVQQENALAVSKHLAAKDAYFLSLWSMAISQEPVDFPDHTPPVSIGRLYHSLVDSVIWRSDIVVLPQDLGLLQQIIGKRTKRRGATLALMPDGIVSRRANQNGGRLRQIVRRLVYVIMRLMGIIDGQPGRMGSSRPNYLFSWGVGWNDALEAASATKTYYFGCPRMDSYGSLALPTHEGRRLLVCSQPMWIAAWSRPYADRWYGFLESLVTDKPSGIELRLRLHPAEINDPRVPRVVREAHTDESLLVSLAWANQVAAPFSTVLVDALAAGRAFFLLSADHAFSEISSQVPLFADTRVPTCSWSTASVQQTKTGGLQMSALRSDYVAMVGKSATNIAAVLERSI